MRCRWDALCCLLVFYMSLALPVEIAFRGDSPNYTALSIIDKGFDLLFLVDVYVNFRTGSLLERAECTNQWRPSRPRNHTRQLAHSPIVKHLI